MNDLNVNSLFLVCRFKNIKLYFKIKPKISLIKSFIIVLYSLCKDVHPRVCGKRSHDFYPPAKARILNGVPAAAKAYPWQVKVILKILINF